MKTSAPRKLTITWPQYLILVKKVLKKIKASNFQPEQVVCISRGGLLPGELISRALSVPLAVISVGSYPDLATQQEKIHFSRDLTTAKPMRRRRVLVIDDLTESGVTLVETVKWLSYWYAIPEAEIKTAVLWHKVKSKFIPDFYAQLINPDKQTQTYPWIVTPQEQF